jgi:hypothetical protein
MLFMAREAMGAVTSYQSNGDDWVDTAANAGTKTAGQPCKTGKTQSGIDLVTSAYTPKTDEVNYFHYENVIGDKDKRFVYSYTSGSK